VSDPTFAIGTGTGRCGTLSLAALLNVQDGAEVTHERWRSRVPWTEGQHWARSLVEECSQSFSEGATVAGDVAFQWQWYAEGLMQAGGRVVYLKRAREEVVESFIRKSGPRDNWQPWPDLGEDERFRFHECFPSVQAESRRDALRAYWRLSIGRARDLQARHDAFEIFPTEALNDEEGVRAILEHLQVPDGARRIKTGIQVNVTSGTPTPA